VRPQVECLEAREVLTAGQSFLPGAALIGVFDPGNANWYLRHDANAGAPDAGTFAYGDGGWKPVVGDWDGDGLSTIGVVDPTTETWYLRNANAPGAPDVTAAFQYGAPGWIPIAGDWTGSGHTGIGAVDPVTETWYLRHTPDMGAPDVSPFAYGGAGWFPVVGDWDGNGTCNIGVVDPASGTWHLGGVPAPGGVDQFAYGAAGWLPVALGNLHLDTGTRNPPQNPEISLSPAAVTLSVNPFDQNTASGYLHVTNTGAWLSTLAYQVHGQITTPGGPLTLSANPPTGRVFVGMDSLAQLSVSGLNTLSAGTYTGVVEVSDQHGIAASKQATVSMTVPVRDQGPTISISPSSLALTPNSDGDTASGVVTISNSGAAGSLLNYQLAGSISVSGRPNLSLRVDHDAGLLSGGQSLQIQVATSGLSTLPAGTYSGALQVSDRNNATASRQIPVSVTVSRVASPVPVISLSASSLTLTANAGSNTAFGLLAITNGGPAGSVLNYQIGGQMTGAGSGSITLSADYQAGQLSAGQSQQVRITASGLSTLSAGTYNGALLVVDQNGVATSRQIPLSVIIPASSGGGNGGGTGTPTTNPVTYRGDVDFRVGAYNSGGSTVPSSLVHGTMTLRMNHYDTPSHWGVDADLTTVTLQQQTPTFVRDAFGDVFAISLSGTYHLNDWLPAGGVTSLDTGAPFEMLFQQDQDNGVYLMISGTFQGGRFVGAAINPGQDTLGGQRFPGFNPPNYAYGGGTGYYIANQTQGVLLLRT